MRSLNLLNIDLNLLVAFEALVLEGHVSRAAARTGMSQPAMSRSLKQLREAFGDALFRRTAAGMVPTPRAIELARSIRPGLEVIAMAIGRRGGFHPATARRRFVAAMADIAAYLALPPIVRRLEREAPQCDLAITHAGNHEGLSKVTNGQVEFAFGVFDYLPPGIGSQNLRPLREVCIADPNNPALIDRSLDLELFLSLSHVAVAMNEDHGTPIDTVLETLGLARRVAVQVAHFLPVPRLVLGTSLVAVVVEDLIDLLPHGKELARFPVPVALEPVMGKMIWHRRAEEDLGHAWFRSMVSAAAASRLDRSGG